MKWIVIMRDEDDGNELMLLESPSVTKKRRKLFPSWLSGPAIIAVLKYLFL